MYCFANIGVPKNSNNPYLQDDRSHHQPTRV